MTPSKKEALEIRKKFIEPTKVPNIKEIWVEDLSAAKQCSMILVNEILRVLENELFVVDIHKILRSLKELELDSSTLLRLLEHLVDLSKKMM